MALYVSRALLGWSALLLTHSHSVFALKWAYLIEVSHNAIGILAVLAGAGGWLELRMAAERAALRESSGRSVSHW